MSFHTSFDQPLYFLGLCQQEQQETSEIPVTRACGCNLTETSKDVLASAMPASPWNPWRRRCRCKRPAKQSIVKSPQTEQERLSHHSSNSPTGYYNKTDFHGSSQPPWHMQRMQLHWGYIGMMEKKMDATIVYWGCIRIMEKKMEATV